MNTSQKTAQKNKPDRCAPAARAARPAHEIVGIDVASVREQIDAAIDDAELVVRLDEEGRVLAIEHEPIVLAFPSVAAEGGAEADGCLEELLDAVGGIERCCSVDMGDGDRGACYAIDVCVTWRPAWVGFSNGALIARWAPERESW